MPRRRDSRQPDESFYARAEEQERIRRTLLSPVEESEADAPIRTWATGGVVSPGATLNQTYASRDRPPDTRYGLDMRRLRETIARRDELRHEEQRRQRDRWAELLNDLNSTRPRSRGGFDDVPDDAWAPASPARQAPYPPRPRQGRAEGGDVPTENKVRLPDRQYAFVVQETNEDMQLLPYILIDGQWWMIERGISGRTPQLTRADVSDLRFYLDPEQPDEHRMIVAYHGVRYEIDNNQRGPQ